MKTLLPPSERSQRYELCAFGLREFAGVSEGQRLDPFSLARFAGLKVVEFSEIQGLSQQTREHLLGPASEFWSGGVCSEPLPDGTKLVILNPSHGRNRINATLMEEICHVFLGHKPSRLAVIAKDRKGRLVARDYDRETEAEAYGVGAASLVPYAMLARLVRMGRSPASMARLFGVSPKLVEYRIKITHLWDEYRRRTSTRSAPDEAA